MSKITSHDITTSYYGCNRAYARVVLWPKEAPDQDTVPHAGKLVHVIGSTRNVPCQVIDGIPIQVRDVWYIALRYNDTIKVFPHYAKITDCSPWKPADKRKYTVADIEKAMGTQQWHIDSRRAMLDALGLLNK